MVVLEQLNVVVNLSYPSVRLLSISPRILLGVVGECLRGRPGEVKALVLPDSL
jgi:hypothetical protein